MKHPSIPHDSLRYLGMPKLSQKQWVEQLCRSKYLEGQIDTYNDGELVHILENRIAKILNKPKGLFFPKGMMAQLAAFKVAVEKRESNNIALHPKSHLVVDEENAYKKLAGLSDVLLGEGDAPFSFDDVSTSAKEFALLSIELPLRRAGFKLPEWEQLEKISGWCHSRQVHIHMDGARLWESTPFYRKNEAEISDLFDSVYVSLYKGLGAMGGAILAGEEDFIEECKVWRTRLCGNVYTLFPMIISALDGLDSRLNGFPELVERTKSVALLLRQFSQLEINEPQTTGFFIFLTGDIDLLNQRAKQLNGDMGVLLFNQITRSKNSSQLVIEIQVGVDHQTISDDEIVRYFKRLLE